MFALSQINAFKMGKYPIKYNHAPPHQFLLLSWFQINVMINGEFWEFGIGKIDWGILDKTH
jgi:hypothetical protein